MDLLNPGGLRSKRTKSLRTIYFHTSQIVIVVRVRDHDSWFLLVQCWWPLFYNNLKGYFTANNAAEVGRRLVRVRRHCLIAVVRLRQGWRSSEDSTRAWICRTASGYDRGGRRSSSAATREWTGIVRCCGVQGCTNLKQDSRTEMLVVEHGSNFHHLIREKVLSLWQWLCCVGVTGKRSYGGRVNLLEFEFITLQLLMSIFVKRGYLKQLLEFLCYWNISWRSSSLYTNYSAAANELSINYEIN